MLQHLAFALCESLQPGLDGGGFRPRVASAARATRGFPNRFEQVDVVDRLNEEVHRAPFHCLHSAGYIAVAGKKNDRQRAVRLNQPLLQFQTSDFGHRNVQHQTARRIGVKAFHEVFGGTKSNRFIARRTQESGKSLENCRIVVDEIDLTQWIVQELSFWWSAMGNCIGKTPDYSRIKSKHLWMFLSCDPFKALKSRETGVADPNSVPTASLIDCTVDYYLFYKTNQQSALASREGSECTR